MLKCEGGECCENGHSGEIVIANVVDPKSGHDWGEFKYCENAIKEDKKRGLIVTIQEKNEPIRQSKSTRGKG